MELGTLHGMKQEIVNATNHNATLIASKEKTEPCLMLKVALELNEKPKLNNVTSSKNPNST